MKRDNITRAVETYLKAYELAERAAGAKAAQMGTTCTKGCTSCCYLLATVSYTDGIVIAEHLLTTLSPAELEAMLEKLKAASWATIGLDGRGVTVGTYFAKARPCVFLDTQTKLCTVYKYRPITCRTHYVISDPKLCSTDNQQTRVMQVDLRELEMTALLQFETNNAPICAPIPVVVLFAIGQIAKLRGDDKLATRVEEISRGIPDPINYTLNSHEMAKPLEQLAEERGITLPINFITKERS